MNNLHWEILDESRIKILPLLRGMVKEFYLAGGTSLALQMGHRDSVDFDFFTDVEFETNSLYEKVELGMAGHKVVKTQDEKNTLSVLIDETIKISFFTHKYPMIKPLAASEYFNLCSVEDIACMKMLAVTTRSVTKDYVDMYFILQKFELLDLLSFSENKYPLLDRNLILKSLVFFDDMTDEPILFKNNCEVSFDVVKETLRERVKGFGLL